MYRENSKGSAVMLNKTGIAYHQMLQLNLAEKYYRLALRADPNYAEAVNNLGTIYYARKSYRRAVNQYKKALRMNPQSASVWSNLGNVLFCAQGVRARGGSLADGAEAGPGGFRDAQHARCFAAGAERGGARQVSLLFWRRPTPKRE